MQITAIPEPVTLHQHKLLTKKNSSKGLWRIGVGLQERNGVFEVITLSGFPNKPPSYVQHETYHTMALADAAFKLVVQKKISLGCTEL
jgi:hypothetical protein